MRNNLFQKLRKLLAAETFKCIRCGYCRLGKLLGYREESLIMEDAKAEFNLEKEDKLMGFFYVGHTDKPWPEGRRKPIEDKVQWVRVEIDK